MPDVKDVIKGLECCISGNPAICKRVGCPYAEEHDGIGDTCIDHLMTDALALLKEDERVIKHQSDHLDFLLKAQEAVEPTEPDDDNMRYCGACGSPVSYEVLEAPGIEYVQYDYCPQCGKAVKWE